MIGGFVCQRKVCVNTVPKVKLILIYIHSISAGTRTAISPQVALPCSQVAFSCPQVAFSCSQVAMKEHTILCYPSS